MTLDTVPVTLKNLFVLHFILDVLVAIPLMFFPKQFLTLLSWPHIDPVSSRLVAAALFGIGIESFLGRYSGEEAYNGMLNLKIIWALTAIAGMLIALFTSETSPFLYIFLVIFIIFDIIWIYWKIKLNY